MELAHDTTQFTANVCEEGFWRSHAAARVDFQYVAHKLL